VLTNWLLSNCQRPVVIIDWSDVVDGHEQLILTAAVPMGGRALPIYEEVHPLRRYNSPRTHRLFLKRLAQIIPADRCPIIVTDAGFRDPWFRQVEALGWDWVGRIRNKAKYSLDEGANWAYTTRLYLKATQRIQHLGWGWLSAKNPYGCSLYLVKKYHRGRGRPRKAHGAHVHAVRCRKLYKDPWLLASSLEHSRGAGKRIVKLYALRMQIEETFRKASPETKRVVNPRVQMQQKLDALQKGAADEGGFLVLLGKTGNVLKDVKDIELGGITYRAGRLDLDLKIGNLQMLDQLKQTLTTNGDLKVEIQSVTTGADQRVQGRMRIEGVGT